MLMLVFIRDLGSSLMFFGAFLAVIYVATARLSYVVIGLAMFLVGAAVFSIDACPTFSDRVDIWLDPFARDAPEGAGQIQQSLFAQADGGLFGTRALASRCCVCQGRSSPKAARRPSQTAGRILPEPHTDFIYAVIVSELGLFGGCALVLIYALIAARGFKTAVMAPDGFSKLLAAGLTAVFALQAFVIIGGVTQGDPADRGHPAVRLLSAAAR